MIVVGTAWEFRSIQWEENPRFHFKIGVSLTKYSTLSFNFESVLLWTWMWQRKITGKQLVALSAERENRHHIWWSKQWGRCASTQPFSGVDWRWFKKVDGSLALTTSECLWVMGHCSFTLRLLIEEEETAPQTCSAHTRCRVTAAISHLELSHAAGGQPARVLNSF